MNTAIGRTETALLTNKSGGSLAQGDVVIVDTANASAVTTTTSGADVSGRVGVVIEPNGMADNAVGLVAFSGWVPLINLSGTGSIGDLIKTHTVAKQGVRHTAPQVNGDFAQALGTSATPAALLFGTVQLGGGSGVTDAEYVTSAAHGSLSAEVIIPGLAASADIAGAAGAGVAYEFDSGASPFTWSAAVDTENVDSTVKSHHYVQDNGGSATRGTYAWSPAGAFDLRAKISFGAEVANSGALAGIGVWNTALDAGAQLQMRYFGAANTQQILAYTLSGGSATQRGTTQVIGANCCYLRITRDGSNNVSFYWSTDGITWVFIATQSITFTAAKAGLVINPQSIVVNVATDWIRSDV